MNIKKVTVFGAGNFGARIAFHIAYNNVDVTVYDRDYGFLEEARTKFREFAEYYSEHFGASQEQINAALANIAYSMDISEAVGNAQLAIEALPEDLEIKSSFFQTLKKCAPKDLIVATTSAGLDPDMLSACFGNKNRFINIHYTGDEDSPTVELVALPSTDTLLIDQLLSFADQVGIFVTVKRLEKIQK